jgi:hypothetical protein
MSILKMVAIAGLAGFGSSMASLAWAQSCQCTVVAPADGSPIGSISSVEGDVRISERLDYIPARAGEALVAGRRILVGQGAAGVSIGGCQIAMTPNTSLTLLSVDQNVCAALEVEAAPLTEAARTTGNSGALIGAVLGVGGIAGIVAIAVSSGGDDSDDGNGVSQ